MPNTGGERSGLERLRWVHTALGLGPLLLFAVYHVVDVWPALAGRVAFAAHVAERGPHLILAPLVVAALVLHAGFALRAGVVKLRAAREEGEQPLLRFQMLSGGLLLVFALVHVASVTVDFRPPHLGPASAYDELRAVVGRPGFMLAYIVGVTALVFHLGVGASRLLQGALPSARVTRLRASVGAALVPLWLAYLQLLSHFALGEGLLP